MVAPADGIAAGIEGGGADGVEDAAEDCEGSQHAEGEGQAVLDDGASVVAGLLDEAHDFEADDGEDAGHEVEDESAEEHAAQDGEEVEEGDGFGRG